MSSEPQNPFSSRERTHDETVSSHGIGTGGADSDRSLIDHVRAGGEQAMASVFDRYAGLVYSVALRVLKDAGQAEDVTQEIFFQLWRNPDSFSFSRGTLGTWLLVVARNRAIDQLRQRRPAESVEDVVVASATNLQSEAETSILMQRVRGILGDLPREQQQSLQMAFFDGLSHSEIAERTGQPLGTVKTRIRSALSSLRKRLEP
jgi:RNA polymerase sigma-70 factor (ECF subfamily)